MLPGVLFLVIVGGVLIGVWIEYYGRTCPACKKRKAAMLAALAINGDVAQDANGNAIPSPPGAPNGGPPPGWTKDILTGLVIKTPPPMPTPK